MRIKYIVMLFIIITLIASLFFIKNVLDNKKEDDLAKNIKGTIDTDDSVSIGNYTDVMTLFNDYEEAFKLRDQLIEEIEKSPSTTLNWNVEDVEFTKSEDINSDSDVITFRLVAKSKEFFIVRVDKENTIMTYYEK